MTTSETGRAGRLRRRDRRASTSAIARTSAADVVHAFELGNCIVGTVPVHLVDHPLVQDALVDAARQAHAARTFRRAATRISVLLAAEALRESPTARSRSKRRSVRRTGGRLPATSSSCRCCAPGWACSTRCSSCVPGARVGPHRPAARAGHQLQHRVEHAQPGPQHRNDDDVGGDRLPALDQAASRR